MLTLHIPRHGHTLPTVANVRSFGGTMLDTEPFCTKERIPGILTSMSASSLNTVTLLYLRHWKSLPSPRHDETHLKLAARYLCKNPFEPGLAFRDGSYAENGGARSMYDPQANLHHINGPLRLV